MLVPTRWLTSHILRTIIIAVPFSLFAWYLLSSSISPSALDTTPSTVWRPSLGSGGSNGKKDLFIQQLLNHDLNPKVNGSALTEVCARKVWHRGLIFSCDPAEGGIGNIRNIILNCVRYAIEAGATQLVLPTVIPLQKSARIKPDPVSLAHFFDVDHFEYNLQNSCPQISFLSDLNVLWDKPSTSPAINLFPRELDTTTAPRDKHGYHQVAFLQSPVTWSAAFSTYIRRVRPTPYSEASPILVSLQSPLLLQWPLTHDTPSFVENFGLLLKFKPEIRRLAAGILYALDQAHRLRYDPLYDATKVQPRLFYGAHLRTGPDAISAGWTSYSVQSQNYLSGTAKAELTLIYVSSDDKEDTLLFAQEAKDRGIEVTNALQALSASALNGQMKAEYNQWNIWDSSFKSCVDWIVLSRASVMGGTWESSFSWGVVMARHRVVKDPKWGLRSEILPVMSEQIPTQPQTSALSRRALSKQPVMPNEKEVEPETVDVVQKPTSKLQIDTKSQEDDADLIETAAKADGKISDKQVDDEVEEEEEDAVINTKASSKASSKPKTATPLKDKDSKVAEDDEEVKTTDSKSATQTIEKGKGHVTEDDEDTDTAESDNSKSTKKENGIKQVTPSSKDDDEDDAEATIPTSKNVKGHTSSKEEETSSEEDNENDLPPPKKAHIAAKVGTGGARPPKHATKPLEKTAAAAAADTVATEEEEEETIEAPPVVSTVGSNAGLPVPNWVKQAFEDGISTIYGPEEEGEMFWGAMWP